jgi:glutaconate CoA-transferase subunit B
MNDATAGEIMVCAAAREIQDGQVCFVGMRLPMLAFAVARRLHAPRALALYEIGLLRGDPPAGFLATMGDGPNVTGAHWATRMSNLMGLMAQGEVDLGFIGGAEVDRFGNLNTSYIGDPEQPAVKLPGSGGGADIAILSRRWVTLMAHERRRLVERVGFVTSPGHGDGTPGWRRRHGLPGSGPSAIVTTLGVFRFSEDGGAARLASIHARHSFDEVQAETGWALDHHDRRAGTTPEPSAEELREVRRLDPDGRWTGGGA